MACSQGQGAFTHLGSFLLSASAFFILESRKLQEPSTVLKVRLTSKVGDFSETLAEILEGHLEELLPLTPSRPSLWALSQRLTQHASKHTFERVGGKGNRLGSRCESFSKAG